MCAWEGPFYFPTGENDMVSAFLKEENDVKYQLLEDGTFAIENYN